MRTEIDAAIGVYSIRHGYWYSSVSVRKWRVGGYVRKWRGKFTNRSDAVKKGRLMLRVARAWYGA